MINVDPVSLEIIKKILRKFVSDCEIRVFGSRITNNIKDYSDLDIAIKGKEKIPREILFAIQEDFEFSDLLFRVDLHDWHRISPEFQKIIEQNFEVLSLQ